MARSTSLLAGTPVRVVALGLAAAVLGALGNALAGPERRLPWRGFGPPPAAAPPTAPTVAPPATAGPVASGQVPVRPSAPASAGAVPTPDAEALAARFPLDPARPIAEVDEAEAWEAFRLGALFVDARRSAAFRAGHIPGAASVPLWEDGLEARLADLKDFRVEDPRRVIVLYCTGHGCPDSRELAQRLFALGLPNLRIYEGGYPGWVAQGRPVAQGAP